MHEKKLIYILASIKGRWAEEEQPSWRTAWRCRAPLQSISSLQIAPNERVKSKVRTTKPFRVQEASKKSFILHFPLLLSDIWGLHGVHMHGANTSKQQHIAFLISISTLPPANLSDAKETAGGAEAIFDVCSSVNEYLHGFLTVGKSQLQLRNGRTTTMFSSLQSPAPHLGKLMSQHSLKASPCWSQDQGSSPPTGSGFL